MATPLIMFAINMLLWFWHTYNENNKIIIGISTCALITTIWVNTYLVSAGITTHTSWLLIILNPLLGALLWAAYQHLFHPLITASIQSFAQIQNNDRSFDSPLFDGGTQDMHQAETHLNMLNQQLYKMQTRLSYMQDQEKKIWTLPLPQQAQEGAQLLAEVEDMDNRLRWLFSSSFDLKISCEKAQHQQVLHKYVFERLREQLEVKMKNISVLQNKVESLKVYLRESQDALGNLEETQAKDVWSQFTPNQQAYWHKHQQAYSSLQVWQQFDVQKSQTFWQHYELMLMLAKSRVNHH